MKSLWVVPCNHDPARPVVVECVRRIRQHHPDDKILVIDSASDDKSYFDELLDLCWIDDIDNRHYTLGAYRHAYEHYRADFYYLIHDSLWLNAPIPRRWGTVRWFSDPPHPWGWDADGQTLQTWGSQQLTAMGLETPKTYRGIMGPMWFSPRQTLHELADLGFWAIDVTDKYQLCAMERVAGIVFDHLGYDVTISLQGEHHGHYDLYDETNVRKLDMARM
jgi:hypothetical protein